PQPPAEAQPTDPSGTGSKSVDASAPDYPITATCRVCDYDYRCVPVPAKCGACGADLPPSAPVGVESVQKMADKLLDLCDTRLRGMAAAEVREVWRELNDAVRALAQQPA